MTCTIGCGIGARLAALVLLAALLLAGWAEPAGPAADPALPEEVVRAWKEAGAEVGWLETNQLGYLSFRSQQPQGELADRVPAFRFIVRWEDNVPKLPDPGTPFGLDLSLTGVTDAVLKELAGLKGLQTLDLSGTWVTDAGLKDLAGLKGLQTLHLGSTRVTDAGLKQLAGLKGLQALGLWNTRVTDAGVRELRKALPECWIVSN